jgi:hypothetical protein
VETEGNKTPRALIVIDWMLLLLKETAIHNRFTEKSNHLKVLDIVMAFKKNCGNIIKVRLGYFSYFYFIVTVRLLWNNKIYFGKQQFATKNIPYALIQVLIN